MICVKATTLTDSQWACLVLLCRAGKAPASGSMMHISAASLTAVRSNPGRLFGERCLGAGWGNGRRLLTSLRRPADVGGSEEKKEK